MSDFLQNLRNGQAEKQHPQKTRKSYDSSYHYTNQKFYSYGGYQNSRSQQMKKPPPQPRTGNQVSPNDNLVTSMLVEAIETLSSHIETLANNQNEMIKVQQKTANMLERQVNEAERIFKHLNIAPLYNKEPEEEKTAKETHKNHYVTSTKSDASVADKKLGREAVMKLIYTLRKEGASFDQIALRLVELGQPTFSGRGEWHAQTVHRLCNKK